MSVLSYLIAHPVDNVTQEITVSERLRGKKFVIRAMTGDEFSEYSRMATRVGKGRNVSFDAKAYNQLMIVNHTVSPDFKDPEAIKQAGCATPEQLLNKVLLAGEMAELAARISELSGFDRSLDEAADEIKNA